MAARALFLFLGLGFAFLGDPDEHDGGKAEKQTDRHATNAPKLIHKRAKIRFPTCGSKELTLPSRVHNDTTHGKFLKPSPAQGYPKSMKNPETLQVYQDSTL